MRQTKLIIAAAITITILAVATFAPIFYHHVGTPREKVRYSLYDAVSMNIAERQLIWPGWD